MNPEDYKNTKTYYHSSMPEMKERWAKIKDQINSSLMTAAQREEALENASKDHKQHIRDLNKEYYAEETRIHDQFIKDVEENWGFNKYPAHVRSAIHSAAWERGHSSGFSEVWNCYYDLIDFVDRVMVGATWVK